MLPRVGTAPCLGHRAGQRTRAGPGGTPAPRWAPWPARALRRTRAPPRTAPPPDPSVTDPGDHPQHPERSPRLSRTSPSARGQSVEWRAAGTGRAGLLCAAGATGGRAGRTGDLVTATGWRGSPAGRGGEPARPLPFPDPRRAGHRGSILTRLGGPTRPGRTLAPVPWPAGRCPRASAAVGRRQLGLRVRLLEAGRGRAQLPGAASGRDLGRDGAPGARRAARHPRQLRADGSGRDARSQGRRAWLCTIRLPAAAAASAATTAQYTRAVRCRP